MLVVGGGL